jgi:hypothetical protein
LARPGTGRRHGGEQRAEAPNVFDLSSSNMSSGLLGI